MRRVNRENRKNRTNRFHRIRRFCRIVRVCGFLAALFLFAAPASAQRLEFAGVLGNSGIAGEALVRTSLASKGRDGSGLNSGVFLDRDLRVWTSGGDAFNCLTFDGRLVQRYPLQPAGSRLDTPAFAELDGVLYAFGHLPKPDPKTRSDVVLFGLPLNSAGTNRVNAGQQTGARLQPTQPFVVPPSGGLHGEAFEAQPVAAFSEVPSHQTGVLCPTAHDGKLLLALGVEADGVRQVAIEAFAPDTKARTRLFTLPGDYACALALEPGGKALFVGGYFGKYVGANVHQPRVHEILKIAWDGTVQWRRECLETPANPTLFRGIVSWAGGALWDTAWYGFFARFDPNGKTAPGKVASWDMRIPYVSQVLDVRSVQNLLPPAGPAETLDPLLLANHSPEHTYLAVWDDAAQEIQLRQRYGSLPQIRSVNLNADGWVNVGTDGIQLWWRFDDAANAPPRFANHSAACTPGAFRGEWLCGISLGERALPSVSRPALGRESAQPAHEQVAPFNDAIGFAVASSTDGKSLAYATDNREKRVWRTTMDARLWAPLKSGWKALTVDGGALTAPGDLTVLADGALMVADGGALIRLEAAGDTLRVTARLDHWGDGPEQHFGAQLRLAGDGRWLLVSDTDRHRVLLVDAARLNVLAQFGTTDADGPAENQLAGPGTVALAGARALVADSGNQRVVKLHVGD